MGVLENKYQAKLIRKINKLFPGCMVVKLDSSYIQGIPDLLVLFKNTWVTLEAKRSADASHRPNQDYYVKKMADMSYSAFIYPENEEVILNEIQRIFKLRG